MVRMSLVISFTKATLSDTVVADFARRSMSAPRLERFMARAARDCPAYGARNVQKVAAGTGEALPGRSGPRCPRTSAVL